jgi:hypothetical protein
MTDEQKARILKLATALRTIAAPVGAKHGFMDAVSAMEAFADGRETYVKRSAEEWIEYAEQLLDGRS